MKKNAILAGVLSIVIFLGSTAVFATSGNSNIQKPEGRIASILQFRKATKGMTAKEKLDYLLANGKITQEKYDEWIEKGNARRENQKVIRRIRPQRLAFTDATKLSQTLDEYVANGKITEEQKAKILNAKAQIDRLKEAVKDMTPKGKLDYLLENGKINQERYDRILNRNK